MSEKKNILKPEDKGDEPPDGLNVALPFKRLGILNPAVMDNENNSDDEDSYYKKSLKKSLII